MLFIKRSDIFRSVLLSDFPDPPKSDMLLLIGQMQTYYLIPCGECLNYDKRHRICKRTSAKMQPSDYCSRPVHDS